MFGLTTRENLIKIVQNASINAIDSYKNSIIDIAQKSDDASDDDALEVLFEYHRKVLLTVKSVFDASPSNTCIRFSLAITSPGICGYEKQFGQPHMAGSVYAMAYWAMTNKSAKIKDVMFLNHWQASIIDGALYEVDKKLSEPIQGRNGAVLREGSPPPIGLEETDGREEKGAAKEIETKRMRRKKRYIVFSGCVTIELWRAVLLDNSIYYTAGRALGAGISGLIVYLIVNSIFRRTIFKAQTATYHIVTPIASILIRYAIEFFISFLLT
jgi:hypothetical protein